MHMGEAEMLDTAKALCPPGHDLLELLGQGAPRWVVPMDNARVRSSSLRLYPALRWRGRARRAVLRAWVALGGVRFTHRISPKRAGDWPLGELLLPDMPTLSTAAAYVGTPGPDQKVTVQLMDDRGRILGYAKYAEKPRIRSLLANEARMLETIPENIGPRLIRFTPFLCGDLLVQEPVPGRTRVPRSRRLHAAQMRLLERLVKPGEAYAAPEHPFIKNLYSQVGGRKSMLERIVADLGGSEWPVAWMHGDLSPWNMKWWHGNYLAFDWEYGRQTGLAYLEAPHALIQVAGVIRGTDPQRAKRTISNTLRAYLPDRYGGFASQIAALSALNMLVSWYPPRTPDDYERWLTTFVEAPGG